MTTVWQYVGVFAAAGLITWAVIAVDDWWVGRDAHKTCRLCYPTQPEEGPQP